MSRFIDYLIESVEVSNTRFAVSLQFVDTGDARKRRAVKEALKECPKLSEIKYTIKQLPNGVFSFNTPLLPCDRKFFQELATFINDMKDESITGKFERGKKFDNREVEQPTVDKDGAPISEAFTTQRNVVSTIFISNPDITEESFVWFVYQTIVNKALAGKARELEKNYGIAIFKSGLSEQYINMIKKAEKAGDKTQLLGILKSKNSLNMNFVTNGAGDKMLSINIGELTDTVAQKIITFNSIRTLLVDILDLGIGIQGSSSFESFKAFEEGFHSGVEPIEPNNANAQKKEVGAEDTTTNLKGEIDAEAKTRADINNRQGLKSGNLTFSESGKQLEPDFAKRFPWLVRNEQNIKGEISIWADRPLFTGTWNDGVWDSDMNNGSLLFSGTWNKGTWKNGIWINGTWNGGTWLQGQWKNGEIYSQRFKKTFRSTINPAEFYRIEKDPKMSTEYVFQKAIRH